MDDIQEVPILCDPETDFSAAIRRAQLSVSLDLRARFVELFTSLVTQQGYAETYTLIHGRFISDLVREMPPESPAPIDSGEVAGTRWELYEGP